MKVSVIGTGYVGLVTGTCLAEIGHSVTGIDIDESKVEKLSRGQVTIFEPGLEEILARNVKSERLNFTTSLEEGIKGAEVIFLALPTPSMEDGSADLNYVLGVADKIGPLLQNYAVVVNKSTVPVGTADRVRQAIANKFKGEFDVVSNPEFLKEGFAVEDFMEPDRIVIGTTSQKAQNLMTELYTPLVDSEDQFVYMDETSSEMTKYAANSFLATKISFMNEIANLCETVGADVDFVKKGIGADDRIGKKFLNAGIGYGGSCFPKDVKALRHTARLNDYDFKILDAVEEVNSVQKMIIVKKLEDYYKNDLEGKTFAVWGLAFKPNTDDIREAPSLDIIEKLIKSGSRVKAFDPEAMTNIANYFNNIEGLELVKDKYDALKDADSLIILTEWQEFKLPDFNKIKSMLKTSAIFDGRNLYNLNDIKGKGIYYISVGRNVVEG